jgi:hypothetical protein
MLYLVFLTSLASAEFLTPVEDQDDVTLPKMCEEDTVISCTLVHIDLDCLNNDTLVFNDTTLTFLDQPGNDSFTFSSEEGDEATFTLDEEIGAVWGHVELADTRDFIIEPLDLDTCPGCHVLVEEDRSAFPLDHKVAPPEFAEMRSDSAWARKVGDLIKKGKTDKTTMVTYTIKIYYTPEVRKSVKNIATMVENVVAQTNQGYKNSKIPVRVKLHCMEETTVPEAQISDLGVFTRYKGGGNNLRGSADAAALLITHSDKWCGVGYMPPIAADQMTSYPFPKLMTSITVTKCAIGSYTFGHEVSHNFGNDHDQYDKTNKIPYAHGYHIPGTKARTIMAYLRPAKYGANRHTQEINYYSNPDVKFKNVPTGVEGKADSARLITEHRFVIAGVGDESAKCSINISGGGGGKPTTSAPATTSSPPATTTTAPATTTSSAPATTTASAPATTTTSDNYYGGGGNGPDYNYYG